MEHVLEILAEALRHSLTSLPILIVIYLLIEWVEYKEYAQFEKSPLLCGKYSPIFGSVLGSIPQCGFSIAATDMFAGGTLSAGALLAVYIATSDEAIPILLSHPNKYLDMILLILIKIILGIIVGYTVNLFYKRKSQRSHEHEHEHDDGDEHEESHAHEGCCHHSVDGKRKFDWKHPIIHSLKIFAYILVINLIMEAVIHAIGEDALVSFLSSSKLFAPVAALLVGLIPNCAASVVLAEFYVMGGLSFGATLTGLCVNAGLGITVLFKANKNFKENVTLVAIMVAFSLAAGYICELVTAII